MLRLRILGGFAVILASSSRQASCSGPKYPADEISDVLVNAARGHILFDPPAAMKQGKEVRMTALITKNPLDTLDELKKQLPADRKLMFEEISVLPYMTVKLDSEDDGAFKIKALQPQDQFVSTDRPSQWDFNVTPLKSGEQDLELVVGMRIKHPGEADEGRFYPLYVRKIDVQVDYLFTVSSFWQSYWQLILTAILIPLFVTGYKWLMGQKKRGPFGFHP